MKDQNNRILKDNNDSQRQLVDNLQRQLQQKNNDFYDLYDKNSKQFEAIQLQENKINSMEKDFLDKLNHKEQEKEKLEDTLRQAE